MERLIELANRIKGLLEEDEVMHEVEVIDWDPEIVLRKFGGV